jgi:hypothetical protein
MSVKPGEGQNKSQSRKGGGQSGLDEGRPRRVEGHHKVWPRGDEDWLIKWRLQ